MVERQDSDFHNRFMREMQEFQTKTREDSAKRQRESEAHAARVDQLTQ